MSGKEALLSSIDHVRAVDDDLLDGVLDRLRLQVPARRHHAPPLKPAHPSAVEPFEEADAALQQKPGRVSVRGGLNSYA